MRGLGVTRGAHPPGPKRSVGLAAGMRIELRAPKGFPVGYYGGWTGHELYVRPVLFYFIPFPLNLFPCVILFCSFPQIQRGAPGNRLLSMKPTRSSAPQWHPAGCRWREISSLLPNNQHQRRTCYALCNILYPVPARIFWMDANSTSYGAAEWSGTPPPGRCVRVAVTCSNKASIAPDALTENSPQSASADCRRSNLPQLTPPPVITDY